MAPRALNHIGAGKLERIGATATRPKLEHIGSRKLDHIGAMGGANRLAPKKKGFNWRETTDILEPKKPAAEYISAGGPGILGESGNNHPQ